MRSILSLTNTVFFYSVLLLFCGALLKTQDYTGHSNTYQYAYGYIKSLNDWFWYSALWCLVVMTLERSMTVAQNRVRSVCTCLQACVLILMIHLVGFISALPQFWEYTVTETFDYGSNETLALSQASEAADSPEYKIMYFWYIISLTVFLPYPMLLLMLIMLIRGMRKSEHSRRRLSLNHTTGNMLNRRVTEELHITRLFIVMIIMYFLFTAPFAIWQFLDRLCPDITGNEELYKGLNDIFQFTFYFYFAIEFLLYCSYSDTFRYSLMRTCCCCCNTSSEWIALRRTSIGK